MAWILRLRAAALVAAVAVMVSLLGQAPPATAVDAPPAPKSVIHPSTVGAGQAGALGWFEQRAVERVIATYKLSPNDGDAVRGWARDQLRLQMWADLTELIVKPSRDANEQLVYEWFQTVVQKQEIAAAEAARKEYFKFSGWNETVLPGETQPSYLTQEPLNYGANDTGYCKYDAPGPYAKDYPTGGLLPEDCRTPCPILGCRNVTPSLQQFTTWGRYVAQKRLMETDDFYQMSTSAIAGMAMTSTLAATAIAVPIVTSVAAAATAGATTAGALATALFPNLAMSTWIAGTATTSSSVVSGASAAGAAAAGSIAFMVGIAVLAIVVTTMWFIQWDANRKLASELDRQLEKAKTTKPDLAAGLVAKSDGKLVNYPGYFYAFYNAVRGQGNVFGASSGTAERPLCRNSSSIYSGTVDGELDMYATWPGCLNAPDIPAPQAGDAMFEVGNEGQATGVQQREISYRDAWQVPMTARVFGNGWFHTRRYDTFKAEYLNFQTLRLTYRGWNGTWYMAERHWDAALQKYRFVRAPFANVPPGTDPASIQMCANASDCTMVERLEYVDSAGVKKWAKIIPGVPTLDVTIVKPTTAIYRPASYSFTALGVDPLNRAISYRWTFPGARCTINGFDLSGRGCQYDAASNSYYWVGQSPTIYFPDPTLPTTTAVNYQVNVVATNSAGQTDSHSVVLALVPTRNEVFFPQPADLVFGEQQDLNITGSYPWNGTIAVAPGSAGVCAVVSNSYSRQEVSATGVGTCTLTATQGPHDFVPNIADSVTRSFTVLPRPAKVSLTPPSAQFSDPLPNLSANWTATGLRTGDTLTGQLTGCTAMRLQAPLGEIAAPAGTYPIGWCTGLSRANYQTPVYSGDLVITREDAAVGMADVEASTGGPDATEAQVTLTPTVTQPADGHLGDLSRATVDVVVVPAATPDGEPVARFANVPVDGFGKATAALTLPTGQYLARMRVSPDNRYFASPVTTAAVRVVTPAPPAPPATGTPPATEAPAPAGGTAPGATDPVVEDTGGDASPVVLPPAAQAPATPVTLPKRLRPSGWTKVAPASVPTNAGQTARVRVTGRPLARAAAPAGPTSDFRTARKKGAVWVWLSGRRPMKVTVSITAPAVTGYTALSITRTYRTRATG